MRFDIDMPRERRSLFSFGSKLLRLGLTAIFLTMCKKPGWDSQVGTKVKGLEKEKNTLISFDTLNHIIPEVLFWVSQQYHSLIFLLCQCQLEFYFCLMLPNGYHLIHPNHPGEIFFSFLLCWPKSSFWCFCNMLWKNSKKHFGQPSIWRLGSGKHKEFHRDNESPTVESLTQDSLNLDKNSDLGDFPGSSVDKTPHSQCQGPGFDP